MDSRIPSAVDPSQVEAHLLGTFSVTVGGTRLADERWPSLRSAHLVQLLALAPQHHLARDQVIECLWPHLDPDAGAANLRKAAHHARQALGRQDGVVLQGGQVQLAPASRVVVDAVAFEQQAQAALASSEAQACAAAADLYTGDLLPAARYEPWTESARERLRSLQTALLRAAGRWEALAMFEPTDEPAHRELMAQALESGNRAVAIRWYARLRQALQQELGVRPDAATQALYRRAIEGLERSGPMLVGRALTRARIDAWAGMPPRERPAGLVVHGPAGIGKSALGRETASELRAAGWTVIEVAAALPGRSFAALAATVEPLIVARPELLDAIGPAARSVLALLTPLALPAAPLPGPLGRHQLIGAVRRLLLAAAEGRDVLLLIDDAHWLDEAEVDVVMHLASSGAPLFVWLAARPPAAGSPLARGAARLVAGGRMQAIDLEPLADDDIRLLAAQASPAPLAPELVDRIVALAEGNPFVATELLRAAAQPGARLPASVAEAITKRLCDLPDAALDLLRRLALANDSFDAPMAVTLAPAGEAQAFAVLDAALASGVLVVDDARYLFRHELVRQALIEQVAPHRRLKLHREIAPRLAELDVPAALVARHWFDGGSVAEAVPWLLAAAHEALRVAAFSDALRHLEPVLAHAPSHAEALRLRAEALDAMGDARAMTAYRAAADAEAGPLAEDLRVKAALAQIKQGDPKGGVEALQGLKPSTPDGRLAEALAYSGAAALGAIDPSIGSAKSAEARRLAMESGDTAAVVIASWAHAAAAHARGELHRTVQADLHDTRQLPHLAMRVFDGQLCMVQRFLYGARPYPEVIAFAQALADEARRLGAARGEAFGITIRGEAELLAGDLDVAERHLMQGAELHRTIGAATGESFALQRLAEVSIHRGRLDEAHVRLDQALDLARQTDVGFHLLDRIYGTRIALADLEGQGRWALDDALEAVRGPLETCPGCRITFAVPAAIAAARAGDVAQAEALGEQSAYLASVVMRLPAWHAAHDEVEGHLALARGTPPADARRHFETAARKFAAAGHPLDAARCREQERRLEG
ncbi:ATP-binding protein [Piscinibacter gummiphilus]|uniref:AAA family ATPase n=1 Tax=Piscinibacter gummiphilus TaxID=946333 RepID=A0ABZ0CLZ7_9BURK|nr:AAA family ATPase [Piscinibacter gummiphilus]WOB06010.1 AAA family ATPase [Piscinibacter gummiphilus]